MAKKIFSVDAPEESLGLLLWQTTITWQRMIKKALEPYGIAHAQFVILAISLWFLHNNQPLTQSVIIRQSKLDKMTVSKSLRKLASLGLIKRAEHETDTRAKTVILTKKGENITSTLIPIVEKVDAEFFGQLKKTEQRTLLSGLNNLVANTDKTIEDE